MKKKLKLDDLKVQSFVTDLQQTNTNQILGGAETVAGVVCANTLKNTNCISDAVRSLCQTCGIICE